MITLQFCAFSGVVDSVIRWFSAGLVAHVDIVMPDGGLLGAQLDADMGGLPSGVWVRPGNYGGMRGQMRVSLPATAEQEATFYAFLRQQIGKPYDKKAIWGFAFARDWRDSKAWFCSELAAAALEHSDILKPFAPANKVTPQELLLICQALRCKDI